MLSPLLKQALLAQTSCGQEDLHQALLSEIDVISACQVECGNDRLTYLRIHLALIEMAQIFSRNKIDTLTRTLSHVTKDTFTAQHQRNMDAEQTSTGRSCNWAAATSAQYFNRNSTDDTVAFSETNNQRTAEKLETGSDKSSRITNGHGFNFSHIETHELDQAGEALGAGQGRERTDSSRVSGTHGGTANLLPLFGTTWVPNISVDTNPPFIHVGDPGPFTPVDFPSNQEDICEDFIVVLPDGTEIHECLTIPPSYGYGFHGTYRISICIPAIGCATLEWGSGKTERQYAHCTCAFVEGQTVTQNVQNREARTQTTATPDQNASSSQETSETIHLVRKQGISTRRGFETIDAQEKNQGIGKGISHAETQRQNAEQAFQQKRSESLTTAQNNSQHKKTDTLTDEETKRQYGQIIPQLNRLWKRIWDQIVQIEKEQPMTYAHGSMCCTKPCTCCNRRI